jgi:hypothetical protein
LAKDIGIKEKIRWIMKVFQVKNQEIDIWDYPSNPMTVNVRVLMIIPVTSVIVQEVESKYGNTRYAASGNGI